MKANKQIFENKVNHDTNKLKEDATAVMEDGKVSLDRFETQTTQSVSKAKDDLTKWVEVETAQFSQKLENLAGEARDTMIVKAKTVQQDLNLGLNQYNTKVQEFADKAPGNFGQKVARYPWVTITVSLAFGLMLGMLLKPARHPLG
jgi:ElaB/YqjD/DUF883 family membrane-anchored ribosome-binding protein